MFPRHETRKDDCDRKGPTNVRAYLTPEGLETTEIAGMGKAGGDKTTQDGEMGPGKGGTVIDHDDLDEVRTIKQLLQIRLILRGWDEEIEQVRSAIGEAGQEIDFGAVRPGEDGSAGGGGYNEGDELVVAVGLIREDAESAGAIEREGRAGQATGLVEIEGGNRYRTEGQNSEKRKEGGRKRKMEAIGMRLPLGRGNE